MDGRMCLLPPPCLVWREGTLAGLISARPRFGLVSFVFRWRCQPAANPSLSPPPTGCSDGGDPFQLNRSYALGAKKAKKTQTPYARRPMENNQKYLYCLCGNLKTPLALVGLVQSVIFSFHQYYQCSFRYSWVASYIAMAADGTLGQPWRVQNSPLLSGPFLLFPPP